MEVEFLPTCGAAQFDPFPPSQVFLSGVFPAAGHNGRHPKNWLSGTPLDSPLYSQGRCLRRAHCGSLRAGAGAARDLSLRAGRLPRWVRGCVHGSDLHSVSLPCSSRSLHAFSSIWSIFPLRLCVIFHVSARATSPFLLLDTHVSFIIQPAFTTILPSGSSITSVSAWARSCPRVPGCSSSS